jgi:hypothetical protein
MNGYINERRKGKNTKNNVDENKTKRELQVLDLSKR